MRAEAMAIACVALAWTGSARAQDAVAVDPAHHKVELENERMRVLRITFPPGAKSVMHSHPCGLAIGLNDTKLTFHFPNGDTRQAELHRGQALAVKPTTHSPENTGSSTAEVMLVEFKSGGC